VDCKEARKRLDGRNGRLGSHLPWGDPRRGWDFVSAGRGDVPWEDVFRMLNSIGYAGPISVEWEDAGMDRLAGAPQSLAFLRGFDFEPPSAAFDAAFSSRSLGLTDGMVPTSLTGSASDADAGCPPAYRSTLRPSGSVLPRWRLSRPAGSGYS
jgi:hypothetical protein